MGATQAFLVETGDKRDGRGHRIATLARRAELVAQYRQSGLTMAAFARRESLAYSTFAGWVWKSDRSKANGRSAFAAMRFAQVQLPQSTPISNTCCHRANIACGTLVGCTRRQRKTPSSRRCSPCPSSCGQKSRSPRGICVARIAHTSRSCASAPCRAKAAHRRGSRTPRRPSVTDEEKKATQSCGAAILPRKIADAPGLTPKPISSISSPACPITP